VLEMTIIDKTLKCDLSIPSSNSQKYSNPGPKPSTIRKIKFGKIDCEYDAAVSNSTKIECMLKDAPVCGSWKPEISTNLGIIPNEASYQGV
jgi:hypothetical protein